MLEQWREIHIQNARQENWRDCFWWYGKSMAVSVLAGAAWVHGGNGLVEYRRERGNEPAKGRGRADLFLNLEGQRFYCAVRQAWPAFSPNSNGRSHMVQWNLDQALIEAKSCKRLPGTCLGIVLISPYCPVEVEVPLPELVASFRDQLEQVEALGRAMVFPDEGNQLIDHPSGRVYPGTAILINEA